MAEKKLNSGVFYGLIAAVFMVVFTFVLYLGGVGLFIGRIAYLGYVVSIGLAATAALMQKKANGGWLEFQAALRTAFTVFVIGLAAQTLFTWILVNFIDTHFKALLTVVEQAKDAEGMKWMGMDNDQVARAMAVERSKDFFSLSAMSLSLAFVCIVHFIIALLIAALVKKKKSE
jgi:hypothetical protein